jgi:hypothetical protein
MTISEIMVCDILNCGIGDIHYLFDRMDEDILSTAINMSTSELGELTCGGVFNCAVETALQQAFEEEYNYDDFEVRFNYLDTDINFVGDVSNYTDFGAKCDKFADLTGHDIQYDIDTALQF